MAKKEANAIINIILGLKNGCNLKIRRKINTKINDSNISPIIGGRKGRT